jgi:hypothetical protein
MAAADQNPAIGDALAEGGPEHIDLARPQRPHALRHFKLPKPS